MGIRRSTNLSKTGGGGASITPIPVVTAQGVTTASLVWPAVPNATSYEALTGPTKQGPWEPQGTTPSPSYDLSGLTPGSVTWFGARATVVSDIGAISFQTTSPVYNPYRNYAYATNWGASLSVFDNNIGTFALSHIFKTPPFRPTIQWSKVRLWMYDVSSAPFAPLGVWFALANGGTPQAPTLDGAPVSWTAATGLKAPPSGSDTNIGVGPVCDFVDMVSTSSRRWVCFRVQVPNNAKVASGGDGTDFTTVDAATNWPGVTPTIFQFSDIRGNPSTTNDWGSLGSGGAAFLLEYGGLSSDVVLLAGIGDSHTNGLTFENDAYQGSCGALGEIIRARDAGGWFDAPDVALVNLARNGHKTTQIRARLAAFEASELDIGGWLVQQTSLNDRVANDITTVISDAMYADAQANFALLDPIPKPLIPIQGLGFDNGVAGWYSRAIAHENNLKALVGSDRVAFVASTILNADGSYKSGRAAPDGLHPLQSAYAELATPLDAAITSALAAYGVL